MPKGSDVVDYQIKPTLNGESYVFVARQANFDPDWRDLKFLWDLIWKRSKAIAKHVEWLRADKKGCCILFKGSPVGAVAASECIEKCFYGDLTHFKHEQFSSIKGA